MVVVVGRSSRSVVLLRLWARLVHLWRWLRSGVLERWPPGVLVGRVPLDVVVGDEVLGHVGKHRDERGLLLLGGGHLPANKNVSYQYLKKYLNKIN